MRLVIDMQGAQSASSRHRGIGRYTLSLTQALLRQKGNHEIVLCLNGLLTDGIQAIRQDFAQLLPAENIRIWHAAGPVAALNSANHGHRTSAELIREAFLASLNPDMVLVSSLFEGLDDNAATSIGRLPSRFPTASILYDLIPLVHRERYLENSQVSAWYCEKLNHLRRADLLLSISESSRQECLEHLGLAQECVVNVSTAAGPQFRPFRLSTRQQTDLRERYGLPRPFVMYTGGIDHRKNIEGLIRAYARLPKRLRMEHQLAVVCSVQPQARAELEQLGRTRGLAPEELILTGFVPEDDLLALYNLCKVFVFPSWHEGFGLPALEAMSCGRAVIGSNNSSVPEVIGCPEALFDPHDDAQITAKLERVLSDSAFRRQLEVHGIEQAKRFSWDASAEQAWAAMEMLLKRQADSSLTIKRDPVVPRQKRLAYVSPLPPDRSGISEYSRELLPALAKHYDIEVVAVQSQVADAWIVGHCPIRSVEWFKAHAPEFDRILYQFGNSRFHSHMFDLLRQHPGMVTLHDFFLSGVLADAEFSTTMPDAWTHALYRSHGYAALRNRLQGDEPFEVIWRYPCNLDVLQRSLGIIVHSENSCRLARQWYGKEAATDWAVIPHLRVAERELDRSVARRQLGLADDTFLVCSFGMLAPTKLNHRLLDAWLSSPLADDVRSVLVFVGESDGSAYCTQLLERIGNSLIGERIRVTDWVDRETFGTWLVAADVGVQLRTLSRGETSGTVLDCMNHGLATIVNAHGAMADLPANAVWLLDDEFADAALREALVTLWKEPAKRNELAAAAHRVILERHDPSYCAAKYYETIEVTYQRTPAEWLELHRALAKQEPALGPEAQERVGEAINATFVPRLQQPQLLLDISDLVEAPGLSWPEELTEIIEVPPRQFRVEPVYHSSADPPGQFRYARAYTCRELGITDLSLNDAIVAVGPHDAIRKITLAPKPRDLPMAPLDRGQRMSWIGRLPERICGIFSSGLNWRQRLRRIPVFGRIFAWVHALLLLDDTRRRLDDAYRGLDELNRRMDMRLESLRSELHPIIHRAELRLDQLESLQIAERLQYFDDQNIERRLIALESLEIAQRLNAFENLNLAQRLEAIDTLNIAQRLNTFDAMNIAQRLDQFEALSVSQRLAELETLKAGQRLNSLEAINVGYRLNRLDALDIANRLHVFDLINIANRLNRLERLGSSADHSASTTSGTPNAPSFDMNKLYVDFENAFRGDFASIQDRQSVYLPYFQKLIGTAPAYVVDVGCGRGEWVELLRSQLGIQVIGIDTNEAMVRICHQRGLPAVCGDAIDYLRHQPPGGLAAVTGFHIIEHLPFVDLIELFDACLHALRPGGLMLFETPNPENLMVGACSFYTDPTHRHPIVPNVAEFLARQRGFAEASIVRLHPHPKDRLLQENSEVARRLNLVLYGEQDYALLAWKSHAT